MLRRGNTNQEVAGQLFLSVKTVAAHLTAVYAKLGVRSRTELSLATGVRMSVESKPTEQAAKKGFGHRVRSALIIVLIFYVAVWGLFLIGFQIWVSSIPLCASLTTSQACVVNGRMYVPWSTYLQWRQSALGNQTTRDDLVDAGAAGAKAVTRAHETAEPRSSL